MPPCKWGFAEHVRFGSTAIVVDAVADYTYARVKGVGPVPRIPPLRLLGGIEAQGDIIQARAGVEYVDGQERIATFEAPT